MDGCINPFDLESSPSFCHVYVLYDFANVWEYSWQYMEIWFEKLCHHHSNLFLQAPHVTIYMYANVWQKSWGNTLPFLEQYEETTEIPFAIWCSKKLMHKILSFHLSKCSKCEWKDTVLTVWALFFQAPREKFLPMTISSVCIEKKKKEPWRENGRRCYRESRGGRFMFYVENIFTLNKNGVWEKVGRK